MRRLPTNQLKSPAFLGFLAHVCTSCVTDLDSLGPRARMLHHLDQDYSRMKFALVANRAATAEEIAAFAGFLLHRSNMVVLTGTLPASGHWCRAWLCGDVAGQVRALPARDSTSSAAGLPKVGKCQLVGNRGRREEHPFLQASSPFFPEGSENPKPRECSPHGRAG